MDYNEKLNNLFKNKKGTTKRFNLVNLKEEIENEIKKLEETKQKINKIIYNGGLK